ncbi:outer membrane beta-barrel protein [Thalassotalea psychrophila]|uniref:Outer membrane beta-barrel protein n=1 Tax=Thalassotalea psychrophila TaxID=3065647 RepID=A0ABY9TX19_9GAMM|nr:outer membrane beta-barrel protein [Colwelliaceae bacterium SQ149]
MKRYLLALLTCVLFSPYSFAQSNSDDYWDITIFAGQRTSDNLEDDEDLEEGEEAFEVDFLNDASAGIILGWEFDYNRTGELLLSHSSTEFDGDVQLDDMEISITYLHIGGTVTTGEGKVPIYIGGGLGAVHLEPGDKTLDSETRPSANLGIGAKFIFNESISLRVDARGYATFFDSDGYLFCSGNKGCVMRTNSNMWLQGEFTAGVTYRF